MNYTANDWPEKQTRPYTLKDVWKALLVTLFLVPGAVLLFIFYPPIYILRMGREEENKTIVIIIAVAVAILWSVFLSAAALDFLGQDNLLHFTVHITG